MLKILTEVFICYNKLLQNYYKISAPDFFDYLGVYLPLTYSSNSFLNSTALYFTFYSISLVTLVVESAWPSHHKIQAVKFPSNLGKFLLIGCIDIGLLCC